MILLAIYILLTLAAVIWILLDAETACVFDVYGNSFRYVWFESPHRWAELMTYGWRLAVLCSAVVLGWLLAGRVYTANPFDVGPAIRVGVAAAMLVGSLASLPWIYIAHRIRWHRRIRRTALQLTELAGRITSDAVFLQSLERADYETDAPWTGWHPKEEHWRSEQLWSLLVPMAYLHNESNRSVLFPVDWETFLGWNVPDEITRTDGALPFHGPDGSSFRVKSIRQLRGCPDWVVIDTEMQSELESLVTTADN